MESATRGRRTCKQAVASRARGAERDNLCLGFLVILKDFGSHPHVGAAGSDNLADIGGIQTSPTGTYKNHPRIFTVVLRFAVFENLVLAAGAGCCWLLLCH